MRRLSLLLFLFLLLLSGCSEYDQVENIGFAVMFGVDLADDGRIEVSAAIPKVAGSRGGESSSGSDSSGQLVFSAKGDDFSDALNTLRWVVPRRLELSQVELIVVSERLARDSRFREVVHPMIEHLYGAARIAVCGGSAKALIETQQPQLGSQTASELTALFEDYTRNGFIPDSTLADFFYRSASFYSDPLAIYAEPASDSARQTAAQLTVPALPSDPDADMQDANRFLGAALFRNGLMTGTLDGRQFLMCKLLRGEHQTFSLSVDGKTVQLCTLGLPDVDVDTGSSPVNIRIRLNFSVLPGSDRADLSLLSGALEGELLGAIDHCRQHGAEPFLFAEKAARDFLTNGQWLEFDWNSQFRKSNVQIETVLHSEHS